jgi:DNA-binding MarR family transcriptional regulator
MQSGSLTVRGFDIHREPRYIAVGVSSDQEPDLGDVPTPALLRAARGAYGQAIRRALRDRGIEDMPPNGPFVIGGIGNQGQPLGVLVQQLRVTKQAASALIDTLVLRDYLSRTTDPNDRRRVNVTLTDRGHEAADAVLAGVMAVDRELTELLGVTGLEQFRAGLLALCDIRDRMESEPLSGTHQTAH